MRVFLGPAGSEPLGDDQDGVPVVGTEDGAGPMREISQCFEGPFTVKPTTSASLRPLRRCRAAGVWESRDGRWVFRRHWSDPSPQRWYAYLDDDEWPANDGAGHVTLRDVVDWAERFDERGA